MNDSMFGDEENKERGLSSRQESLGNKEDLKGLDSDLRFKSDLLISQKEEAKPSVESQSRKTLNQMSYITPIDPVEDPKNEISQISKKEGSLFVNEVEGEKNKPRGFFVANSFEVEKQVVGHPAQKPQSSNIRSQGPFEKMKENLPAPAPVQVIDKIESKLESKVAVQVSVPAPVHISAPAPDYQSLKQKSEEKFIKFKAWLRTGEFFFYGTSGIVLKTLREIFDYLQQQPAQKQKNPQLTRLEGNILFTGFVLSQKGLELMLQAKKKFEKNRSQFQIINLENYFQEKCQKTLDICNEYVKKRKAALSDFLKRNPNFGSSKPFTIFSEDGDCGAFEAAQRAGYSSLVDTFRGLNANAMQNMDLKQKALVLSLILGDLTGWMKIKEKMRRGTLDAERMALELLKKPKEVLIELLKQSNQDPLF